MSDSIFRETPARYGWRTVRLGDVITAADTGFASGERASDGIIQVRMQNLDTRGNLLWRDLVRVPRDGMNERFLLQPGDVLFNNTNSTDLVGKSAEFGGHKEAVTFSNHFTRLRVQADMLDSSYLSRYLNSLWCQRVFAELCRKWIGQSAVKWSQLAELTMPLPTLGEQRQIAARLKEQMVEADAARASAEVQLGSVGALLESFLRVAFCGIVPLSIGRDNATPPAGWHWLRLLDLARLESGHTPSRKHADWWGGDVSWIALPDIRRLDCREVHETIERTNALGLANSSARLLPPGTVCLSRTASVGFVTIMGREMTTSQDFVNWVCGPGLDPWFLLWALRAARDFIRAQSTGAIHQTVYMPVAKSFEICAPPIAEQRRIAERLREQFTEIERARTAATAQLDALKALPAALLRAAFADGTNASLATVH